MTPAIDTEVWDRSFGFGRVVGTTEYGWVLIQWPDAAFKHEYAPIVAWELVTSAAEQRRKRAKP